jgi:ABC-type transport system involved in cytochrome bd biosynthesis fused ATPase/permease subunit
MGDRAMLIPANQGNLVWTADTQNLSTGQSALLRIQEAASQVAIIYILLDEWDANLDEENTSDVDQMLNELSQTKVVIEVRH